MSIKVFTNNRDKICIVESTKTGKTGEEVGYFKRKIYQQLYQLKGLGKSSELIWF